MGDTISAQTGLTEPTSQFPTVAAPAANPPTNATAQPVSVSTEPLPENIDEPLAVDDMDDDSAYGSSIGGETASVTSSIYRGYLENGRKYQTLKEEGYFLPADEQQFESLEAGHVYFRVLDCQEENQLFRSPIGGNAQNVLDIGTGDASWAIDVADNFPHLTVRGVDLYPPAETIVPPNCTLEIDDITKPWTWNEKFDLIHLRLMMGSFTPGEWTTVYKQAYDNLVPGGWIEHCEMNGYRYCDDETMPADSLLAQQGDLLKQCGEAAGRPLTTMDTMRASIEAAGFINVHEKNYKAPVGTWPSHPIYKDAGRLGMEVFLSGMEGWMMYLLTRFGPPTPWSPEEVQIYVAKVRKELDSKWHIYQKAKRIWAQKPHDAQKA